MEPFTLIKQFVQAVNDHNIEDMALLMCPDHQLIDAWEQQEDGRHNVQKAWEKYFGWFPHYYIEMDQVLGHNDLWAIFGHAGNAGPDPNHNWRLPACWKIILKNDRIHTWQIYCDTNIPFSKINNPA